VLVVNVLLVVDVVGVLLVVDVVGVVGVVGSKNGCDVGRPV
jgi:hypothetical protein